MMDSKSGNTWSPEEHSSLPQYGFGQEFAFHDLVNRNPFIFRVHTPKPRSPFFDSTEPYFVGQRFNERYTHSPPPLDELCDSIEDISTHMDWTKRPSSPYISASFSFAWAMWEALRRYQTNVKHDVEIAVIDARAVASHSVTALELLRKIKPKERHHDYWKWYRFAVESQDVLVYGAIPGTAVLASIPLLSLLDKLPSYFVRPGESDPKMTRPDGLGWHSSHQKPSFRQFCQDMSDRFLAMATELRLRDTTVQSIRLAMAFLRPWFHKVVQDDFVLATSTLCELSFVIAQWPGQWWVRDHGSMWDLIRATVNFLGEEVREQQKLRVSEEMERLQDVIDDLARAIKSKETPAHTLRPSPKLRKKVEEPSKPPRSVVVPTPKWKLPSVLETASCVVTGFLLGSFISLCILSTQRRSHTLHVT